MAAVDGPEAGTFVLTVVDLEGDTVFNNQYRFEAEPLPRDIADSALHALVERMKHMDPSLADAVEREAEAPPLHPSITSLLIGKDGSIWIEQHRLDRRPLYYVVNPDGNPVGVVELERGSRIGAAALAQIWVLESDELGVESVVRYAVEWAN